MNCLFPLIFGIFKSLNVGFLKDKMNVNCEFNENHAYFSIFYLKK